MKLAREKYLIPDEFKRLLYQARVRKHVNAPRDYAILALHGATGLRPAEVLGIRVCDLFLNEQPAYVKVVRLKKREKTEDSISIGVLAARVVRNYVRTLPDADRLKESLVFPITTRTYRRMFKTYCRLAGIGENRSTHALRHYRALELYRESKDLLLVKECLGHSRAATTEIYARTINAMEEAAKVDIPIDAEEDSPGVDGK